MESTHNKIKIENDIIDKLSPCYIIVEIGVNHNGKLSIAKKLIDAAVECGANAVKFQKRNLESLYRKEALEDPNSESQGFEILLAELKEVELSKEDYIEIVNYCKKQKITFLCTPWDIPSVDFLEQLGTPAYKIASGDMTNFPLIKYVSQTEKPMIISNGMSKIEAEALNVKWAKKYAIKFLIFRLPLIAGINPIGNLGSMINGIKKGYYFNIGRGGAKKSIVLASDIALLIKNLSENMPSGIYNLTDGYHPSFRELSNVIAGKLNKPQPYSLPLKFVKVVSEIQSP